MTGVVIIDTNLLILLVVGSADKKYITMHKRLRDVFAVDDFELLGLILAQFSNIVLLPHILAEVSSLVRQIENPAKLKIIAALGTLIETCGELPVASANGVRRSEFDQLGLTDSVILHLCGTTLDGLRPTLLTTDTNLANSAHSQGYSVIDYQREYQH